MIEESRRYSSVAPLRNVAALVELINRVQERERNLPGMACYYGPSGYGKTTAAVYAANAFEAVQVEVRSTWTQKKLCEAILEDLGEQPRRTIAAMVDQISESLARSGRPLLIDEADHLVKRGMIELARDFYEASGCPVILIGEEQLPKTLEQWERVHGRMLDWVGAEPGELQDVTLLARIYCPEVDIEDELQAHLLQESERSIRRICVNLNRIAEWAKTHRAGVVTRKDWGGESFFNGRPPAPRRFR